MFAVRRVSSTSCRRLTSIRSRSNDRERWRAQRRAASYDLSQYGTTNLWSLKLTLVEPLITMVMIGIVGAVVGTVLGHARPHNNQKTR